MPIKPKVIGLFCGAGGLDLGFKQAGYEIVCSIDNNSDSCNTYRQNMGGTVLNEDISTLKSSSLPLCDIVIGGPPCQGFSVAGHMDPNDPRSAMVWHFIRIVSELSPKAFVMENVAALANLSRWQDAREKIALKFEEAGYKVKMFILNAKEFGVPQSRERVFFIGTKSDIPHINKINKPAKKDISVKKLLKNLPPPGEVPNLGVCKAKITPAKKPVLRRSPFAGMLFNGQGRPINLNGSANTLPASMGGNRTPIIDENELRLGKPPWIKEYHKHLINGGKPVEKAPDYLRRLTVTEAKLIQGFPENFEFTGSQCSQFRQIGNAVPPPLAKGVAENLLRPLNGYKQEVGIKEQMLLFV